MTRKYQGLIVLNTKNLEGTIEELVKSVRATLETEGAKIENVTEKGRQEFAYPSKHLAAGHYVQFDFTGCSEIIDKVQARLKLNNHVHVYQFLRA